MSKAMVDESFRERFGDETTDAIAAIGNRIGDIFELACERHHPSVPMHALFGVLKGAIRSLKEAYEDNDEAKMACAEMLAENLLLTLKLVVGMHPDVVVKLVMEHRSSFDETNGQTN